MITPYNAFQASCTNSAFSKKKEKKISTFVTMSHVYSCAHVDLLAANINISWFGCTSEENKHGRVKNHIKQVVPRKT